MQNIPHIDRRLFDFRFETSKEMKTSQTRSRNSAEQRDQTVSNFKGSTARVDPQSLLTIDLKHVAHAVRAAICERSAFVYAAGLHLRNEGVVALQLRFDECETIAVVRILALPDTYDATDLDFTILRSILTA